MQYAPAGVHSLSAIAVEQSEAHTASDAAAHSGATYNVGESKALVNWPLELTA